jgi:hypothetical protein
MEHIPHKDRIYLPDGTVAWTRHQGKLLITDAGIEGDGPQVLALMPNQAIEVEYNGERRPAYRDNQTYRYFVLRRPGDE